MLRRCTRTQTAPKNKDSIYLLRISIAPGRSKEACFQILPPSRMASNLAAKYEQKTDIPDKRTLRREIKQRLSSLKEEEIYKQCPFASEHVRDAPSAADTV